MKNLKRTLLVILGVITAYISTAQKEKSIIYKISGNGMETPSYLIGTMHFLCDSELEFKPEIENALEDVSQIYMELDFDDPAMATKMQQLSMDPKMKEIYDALDEEKRLKMDTWFKNNFGAGMDQLSILKPFTLYSMMITKQLPCTAQGGTEIVIMNMAKEKEMEILGLETIEIQMGFFDKIPAEEQINWMLSMIENEENYKQEFEKMLNTYLDQDLNSLIELSDNFPEMAKYQESLLDNRNETWIPAITREMKKQPTLFAVGAAHLPGEKGVITLLKEEGYNVEAL